MSGIWKLTCYLHNKGGLRPTSHKRQRLADTSRLLCHARLSSAFLEPNMRRIYFKNKQHFSFISLKVLPAKWPRALIDFVYAFFRKPKVCEHYMTLSIQNDVIRFQVSENNVSLVQIFKRKYNLSKINPCLFLWKSRMKNIQPLLILVMPLPFFSLKMLAQVSSRSIIKDQK